MKQYAILEREQAKQQADHRDRELCLQNLLIRINGRGGFLTSDDLKRLADLDRLRPVLVRCGGGRFTCPAQDAEHFMGIVNDSGKRSSDDLTDYVRDVSQPTSDPIYSRPAPPLKAAKPPGLKIQMYGWDTVLVQGHPCGKPD